MDEQNVPFEFSCGWIYPGVRLSADCWKMNISKAICNRRPKAVIICRRLSNGRTRSNCTRVASVTTAWRNVADTTFAIPILYATQSGNSLRPAIDCWLLLSVAVVSILSSTANIIIINNNNTSICKAHNVSIRA